MKRLMFLCIATITFSNCKIFHHSEGKSGTVNKRWNMSGDGKDKSPDSVVVTGAQYIPLYGRSETGINPDLEGAWSLESMDGFVLQGDIIKRLDSIAASKVIVTLNSSEPIAQRGAKITPEQGSKYHIPEAPSINFFGANETFSGFTGCNKYSGRFEMADSNSISLKNTEPSTKMFCIGYYDEKKYIENLHKVNKFKGMDSKLELLEGDKVILTFTRKSDNTTTSNSQ